MAQQVNTVLDNDKIRARQSLTPVSHMCDFACKVLRACGTLEGWAHFTSNPLCI